MLNLNLLLCCVSLVYLNKGRIINGLRVLDQLYRILVVLNSRTNNPYIMIWVTCVNIYENCSSTFIIKDISPLVFRHQNYHLH